MTPKEAEKRALEAVKKPDARIETLLADPRNGALAVVKTDGANQFVLVTAADARIVSDPTEALAQVKAYIESKPVLEVQKLEREIQNLEKPWFKRPRVIFGIVSALVALVSLALALNTTYNELKAKQVELGKLQAKEEGLNQAIKEAEAKQLQATAAANQAMLLKMRAEREQERAEEELAHAERKKQEVTDELEAMQDEIANLRNEKGKLSKDFSRFAAQVARVSGDSAELRKIKSDARKITGPPGEDPRKAERDYVETKAKLETMKKKTRDPGHVLTKSEYLEQLRLESRLEEITNQMPKLDRLPQLNREALRRVER